MCVESQNTPKIFRFYFITSYKYISCVPYTCEIFYYCIFLLLSSLSAISQSPSFLFVSRTRARARTHTNKNASRILRIKCDLCISHTNLRTMHHIHIHTHTYAQSFLNYAAYEQNKRVLLLPLSTLKHLENVVQLWVCEHINTPPHEHTHAVNTTWYSNNSATLVWYVMKRGIGHIVMFEFHSSNCNLYIY